MPICSVLCPDGSFHLFSREEYADKFAKYYNTNYKEMSVDNPTDMTVIDNLSNWEIYQFTRQEQYEHMDSSDSLYVCAKNEDHANRILTAHNVRTHEYYAHTVDLCDFRPGTTLECLYNFNKEE